MEEVHRKTSHRVFEEKEPPDTTTGDANPRSQISSRNRAKDIYYPKGVAFLKKQTKEQVEFFRHILEQVKIWLQTGHHPKDKIVSLWQKTARAISKGKAGKAVEFGGRWVITRLVGGYVSGSPCQKLGADADTSIADEVIINFLNTLGEVPEFFIYDRGADSRKNTQFLKELGVENICIFPKGNRKLDIGPEVLQMVRKERSLNESTIANIKAKKYNFTKPRAKLTESCVLKGHFAMLGFNFNLLFRDLSAAMGTKLEIT